MKGPIHALAFTFASLIPSAAADWRSVMLHPGWPARGTSALATGGGLQGGYASLPTPPFDVVADQPMIWETSSSSMRSLLPAEGAWYGGQIVGMSAHFQVGNLNDGSGLPSPVRWQGSAETCVLLPQDRVNYSAHTVEGTAGRQAVGSANRVFTGNRNAILWDFDSASPTVLHPTGARWSYANATDGRTQGGRVFFNTFGQFHAALWSGSAASFIDLHPDGFRESEVRGVADGVQVGHALTTSGRARAMLWRGTAQSAVDLTPDDVYQALVYATTGQYHVGSTYTLDVGSRATLWLSDDPASAVNLHNFLDDGWITSIAVSASMHDGKLYISGRGSHRDYFRECAVVWVLDNVPAPGTLALPLAAAALAIRRRRGSLY